MPLPRTPAQGRGEGGVEGDPVQGLVEVAGAATVEFPATLRHDPVEDPVMDLDAGVGAVLGAERDQVVPVHAVEPDGRVAHGGLCIPDRYRRGDD
ncbi:hypothetical protein ACWCXB_27890 [Streptomyces sp. NPDC001514]